MDRPACWNRRAGLSQSLQPMSANATSHEESTDTENTNAPAALAIDARTRRACEQSMTVVPHGGGSGMFDVYSASGGEYVVDLRDGVCTCPDYVHREPEGGCKHQLRVKFELGILEPPAGLRSEHSAPTDVELARKRRGLDQDPEPEPVELSIEETAAAFVRHSEARTVATDGGRDLEDDADADACENGEIGCSGPGSDELPCFECYRSSA